ncbi:EAL and GGDEF domain-containing protein [Frankia sp. Cr2]|uniref:sensor domain-containing protein n=1 Tax=Frankia sp. Cr2 TaxID=3073932 RepID=UPI002AD34161|nr:EAL domain-containing protein [Frankia sp. Cr2]
MGQAGERLDLFDHLDIGMLAVGTTDRRVQRVNAATCRILGRSESELLTMSWDMLLHPADRAAQLVSTPQSAAGGQADGRTDHQTDGLPGGQRVVRFTRPDGSTVYVLATAILLRDGPDGEPYYLSQFQDITQEMTAHHHLRLLLDNTPVALFLMDPSGRIVFADGEMNAARVDTAQRSTIVEAFQDLPVTPMARRALTGERVSGVIEAHSRRFETHMVPIVTTDGAVTSVAVVATDVTEREEALTELRIRSAEQAIVADLGRRALASLEPDPLWAAAVTAIADHLHADSVTIHEQRPGHTGPHRAARVGTPPPATNAACALTVPIGPPEYPTAILTVHRTMPFADCESAFIHAVATVLGAAAARFQVEREARYHAWHDSLTGLPNRTALLDRLQHALTHTGVGILFIDLDGFKTVNDSLGHHTGDQLLRTIATRLQHAVRPHDIVARLSGDEFAILCENITSAPTLQTIADRVVTTLAQPTTLDGRTVTVTASVGIAISSPELADPDDLLRAADIAMYTAKHSGRGHHLLFDEAMRACLLDRLTTENDLRHALAVPGELRLHYQAILNPTGDTIGAEALIRWQHPTRGLLLPDIFIPLAEDTGLITSLGRWALHTACHAAAAWTTGPPPIPPPHITINVSARQLTDPGFLPDLTHLLHTTNPDDRYQLCLEITESALIQDTTTVTPTLHALRALGITLYIDDFGSSHSSLSRLHRLPLDGLKIDRRFISTMTDDPTDHAIVTAVIHLAHTLGLTAIAEGIETPAQLAALSTLRCDLLQGYHLARPGPHLPALEPATRSAWPAPEADHRR